ncbi:MAG TPA: hypothetical protein PLZ61_04295 [Candidatus Cryosericum sp.]|nr:hypothetical protein [Candidatus Cryosericum sp.]
MENDWIWTPKGIRQVRDSGANSNEHHENFRAAVRKHGLASPMWCDYRGGDSRELKGANEV